MSETATPETETRVETYRVFRQDGQRPEIWHEQERMTGEGRWGYHIDAEMLGERFGPGTFLLVQDEGYKSARFVTVIAETHWREQRHEEEGEGYVVEL